MTRKLDRWCVKCNYMIDEADPVDVSRYEHNKSCLCRFCYEFVNMDSRRLDRLFAPHLRKLLPHLFDQYVREESALLRLSHLTSGLRCGR